MIQGISSNSLVYLNGEYVPVLEAKISVLDRGFIFGDGIYEVVPAYNRKPFGLEGHVARLERSLKAVRIDTGKTTAQWYDLFLDMIQRSESDDSFIYLQVTRGVAKRDHQFPQPPVAPTIFMSSTPFARPNATVREKGMVGVTLDDERWLHCEIKSISLLGNILAKQYAVDHHADEVVQFRNGFLTEGSSSNIWVVKNNKLIAPLKNNLILEGIRYGMVQQFAEQLGIAFEARDISQEEVLAADELMLTSATKEILALTQLNGKPVGAGVPGPIFKRLRQAYDDAIAAL